MSQVLQVLKETKVFQESQVPQARMATKESWDLQVLQEQLAPLAKMVRLVLKVIRAVPDSRDPLVLKAQKVIKE